MIRGARGEGDAATSLGRGWEGEKGSLQPEGLKAGVGLQAARSCPAVHLEQGGPS